MISGSGDLEKITLEEDQYMTSDIITTGAVTVTLTQNQYRAGDDVTILYRTGATEAACIAADWEFYA